MKKKILKKIHHLGSASCLFDGKTLNEILAYIKNLANEFGSDAKLDEYQNYDYGCQDGYSVYDLIYKREETDKELATRIKKSESAKRSAVKAKATKKKKKEEKDLLEYERLKAKFG